VLIVVQGRDLPGRRFAEHGNVHVGVQRRRDVTELVPGDAGRARWELVVDLTDTGDFKGPHVQGRRGDRFVYLSWTDVAPDGTATMFRRAKLMLGAVPADVLAAATRPGWSLLGELPLTDAKGGPVCAAVRPPAIAWSAGFST
jgi:hypothetical protein